MNKGGTRRKDEVAIKLVGDNIRKYRIAKNLTILELATLVDSENDLYSQISRMELGKVNTNITMIFAVAKALGIEPHKLLM